MNRLDNLTALRAKLSAGGQSVGSWIQIPHSSIAEIMGQAGFDWVAVDMEHGSVSPHQLPDLFRALELGNTLPLARLAQGSIKDCKQALDAGAAGVIVPMIEGAAQLEAVRDACRWPPSGKRGVGFSRANGFGANFESYVAEAQAPLLVAMIEHVNAVDSLPEILSVIGLDAILVGPYDLSASLGMTACFDSQQFNSAMQEILARTAEFGIPCGLHVVQPDYSVVKQRIDEGYRFLAYSIDSVFLTTAVRNLPLPGVCE